MAVDPSNFSTKELEDYITIQHYAAIGYVAANWAQFESVIDSCSLWLAGMHPKQGTCLTSQIAGHGRKLDAFIAIANLYNPKHGRGGALDQFCKDAAGMAEQRNRIIHDEWDTSDIVSPLRMEATARKKLRLEKIKVPTADILAFAHKIGDLRLRFEELVSQIAPEPLPSPGTPPQMRDA